MLSPIVPYKPTMQTWDELIDKWGRYYFTDWMNSHSHFKHDFFAVAEFNHFSKVYWNSLRTDCVYNNKTYTIITPLYDLSYPAWWIRFDNGAKLIAFPENIIPHEMIACGYRGLIKLKD